MRVRLIVLAVRRACHNSHINKSRGFPGRADHAQRRQLAVYCATFQKGTRLKEHPANASASLVSADGGCSGHVPRFGHRADTKLRQIWRKGWWARQGLNL